MFHALPARMPIRPLLPVWLSLLLLLGAVLPANGQLQTPFIWELSKPGGQQRVTLMGSLHIGRADFFPLPDAVQKRFDAARVLAVEADVLLPETQQICERLARTDIPLDQQLPAEDFAALQAYVRASNIPPRLLEGKKLWMINLILTAIEMTQLGIDFNRGIDIALLSAARNAGKRIVEIEGATRQCTSLAQASDDEALAGLQRFIATVRENRMEKRLNALMEHYRQGDAAKLLELIDEEFGTSPNGRRARSRLFEDRHPHMADVINSYLDRNELHFIVVGVGHMLGANNLLEQLAKRGIKAERIKP